MSEEQPGLGQLIWLVRRELEWVHTMDADHPLRFDVGSVELDVAVEVTQATSGGGGLDLKVMGVGASGDLSREVSRGSTSTVHVVLTPRDTRLGDGKFDVSALDRNPPPRWAKMQRPENGRAADSHSAKNEEDLGPEHGAPPRGPTVERDDGE